MEQKNLYLLKTREGSRAPVMSKKIDPFSLSQIAANGEETIYLDKNIYYIICKNEYLISSDFP